MARYLSAEIGMDEINEFFSIGKPLSSLKTIKKENVGIILDSQTGEPIEQISQLFGHMGVKSLAERNRVYDPTYGERMKQQEVAELLTTFDEQEGTFGQLPDSNLHRQYHALNKPRQSRQHDLESLTMTTMSTESRRGNMAPLRSSEQVQHLSREYQLEQIPDRQLENELPIDKHQDAIVNQIEANTVTVIKGETGSGKTTRVPLMILNDWREKKGKLPNIIVTQPRKIAAVSVCRRVCDEQNWVQGKICGYQVSLDRCASDDTCILYCTTGILLQKLIQDKNLLSYTHIILDEVHDREADMDFCLLVIKQLLKSHYVSSQVKVILMSATLETETFCDYFSFPVSRRQPVLEPAQYLSVGGKPFEVAIFYSDEFCRKLNCAMPKHLKDDARLSLEARQLGIALIDYLDVREAKGWENEGEKRSKGSVLCFLPGLPEIEAFNDDLTSSQTESKKFQLIQLHSSISISRQVEIFKRAEKGMRKIILATNIAESSITVPDVKYVLDFSLTKRLHCDAESNLQHLKLEWTSKASSQQRSGRAGRVQNGVCYRMVERSFYNECMDEQEVPEMQRSSLSHLVLKAKRLNLYPPKKLLSLAMDHPGLDRIERAVLELKELEALTSRPTESQQSYEGQDLTEDDLEDGFDGDLTFVGLVMADIPLDVHLTKLILMGHVFGFLEEAIIMACSTSQQSFFLREFDYKKQLQTFYSQHSWSNDSESDLLAALNAYKCWESEDRVNRFYDKRAEKQWEQQHCLDIRRLRDVHRQMVEVLKRLSHFNIHPSREHAILDSQADSFITRDFFLKIIIAGAFYPNYFVRMPPADPKETKRYKRKEMNNHNPHTTVYLKGFDEALAPLYEEEIRKFFHEQFGRKVLKGFSFDISFEGSKAYVEFIPDLPYNNGNEAVLPPVLVALKLEQIISSWRGGIRSNPINKYKQMTLADAHAFKARVEQEIREGRHEDLVKDPQYPSYRVAPPRLTYNPIWVQWVTSPEHFWGTNLNEETDRVMHFINHTCNQEQPMQPLQRSTFQMSPNDGLRISESPNLCLAKWFIDGQLYRAVPVPVKSFNPDDDSNNSIKVFFVDYGNEVEVSWSNLYPIPASIKKLPHQAMEFNLKGVKPKLERYYGVWPTRSESISAKSKSITDKVTGMIESKRGVFVEIFSVVRGVIRCDLIPPQLTRNNLSYQHETLNSMLIKHGQAEETPESAESLRNHEDRCRARDEEEKRGSLANRPHIAEVEFYGSIPPPAAAGDDGSFSHLSSRADKKLREANKVVQAMERTQGNMTVNWDDPNNSGGGRYPARYRQGLFQGPYNAYTYDLTSMTRAGQSSGKVKISEDSVNCVGIDNANDDSHDRLMVAACVSLNSTGSTIRARGSTLMPDIKGLPAIVTLLFTPQADFQTDNKKRDMLGARCGLGWVENNFKECVPLYPDHDIELVFDTVMDVEDVRSINTLRLLIHNALDGDLQNETMTKSQPEVKKEQVEIREYMKELLMKSRKPANKSQIIRWRPWGKIEGLSLNVPLGKESDKNLLVGKRMQLHTAITPAAQENDGYPSSTNHFAGHQTWNGSGQNASSDPSRAFSNPMPRPPNVQRMKDMQELNRGLQTNYMGHLPPNHENYHPESQHLTNYHPGHQQPGKQYPGNLHLENQYQTARNNCYHHNY